MDTALEAAIDAAIKDEIRNRVDNLVNHIDKGDMVRRIVSNMFGTYSMEYTDDEIIIKVKRNI